uniref:Plexin_cytopl domain-containing protein n=1 Tax=Haemonchus placei TaxID=6290 RepID=A0A0N4VT59_HAEPC
LAGVSQDRMNIKYSLKDWLHSSPAEQHFDIDESSGEVYVTKALDYEETKFYTEEFMNNAVEHRKLCC